MVQVLCSGPFPARLRWEDSREEPAPGRLLWEELVQGLACLPGITQGGPEWLGQMPDFLRGPQKYSKRKKKPLHILLNVELTLKEC